MKRLVLVLFYLSCFLLGGVIGHLYLTPWLLAPYVEQRVKVDGFDAETCMETFAVTTTAWSRKFPVGYIIEHRAAFHLPHDRVEITRLDQEGEVGYAIERYLAAKQGCAR